MVPWNSTCSPARREVLFNALIFTPRPLHSSFSLRVEISESQFTSEIDNRVGNLTPTSKPHKRGSTYPKMESPLYKPPDGTSDSSPKLVHFPQINNNDGAPFKRENPPTTPRKYHRAFSDVFPFWRSKRNERPFLDKNTDRESALRKTSLKPVIHRSGPAKMEGFVEAEPYRWPHDGSLDPRTTALVIIDMQKDCKSGSHESY